MGVSELPQHIYFFERLPEDRSAGLSHVNGVSFTVILAFFFIGINLASRAYLDNYTPNLGFWLIRQKWDLLLSLDEPQELLILGDSTANQGLVPEIVQQETGLKTVNLATVANLTLLNNDWMLKAYLQKFRPPQIVLIMNTYQTWHRRANLQSVNTIPYFGIQNRNEVFSPAPNGTSLDRVGQALLHYLPTYSENDSLRLVLRDVLKFPPDFSLVVHNSYSLSPLGGYAVYQQVPRDLNQDIERHLLSLQEASFISDENIAALDDLRDLAETYNFQVYLINSPIVKDVADSPDFIDYFEPIDSFLKNFASTTTNIHYMDEQVSYPKKDMQSADHLLFGAAVNFTDHLVDLLFK